MKSGMKGYCNFMYNKLHNNSENRGHPKQTNKRINKQTEQTK